MTKEADSHEPAPFSHLTSNILHFTSSLSLLYALLKTVFCILYHITSIHPSSYHLHTFVVLIAESFLPSHSLGILQGEGVGQQFQQVARSTFAHSLLAPIGFVDVLAKELHLAPEVVVQAPANEARNESVIGFAFQFSFILTFRFKVIKIFQEQHPRFLLLCTHTAIRYRTNLSKCAQGVPRGYLAVKSRLPRGS